MNSKILSGLKLDGSMLLLVLLIGASPEASSRIA